jgi:acyl-CoA hydrolase
MDGFNYKDIYKGKLINIADAISMIKSGDFIIAAQAASEPPGLLSSLHKIKGKVKNVTMLHSLGMQNYPYFTEPGMADCLLCDSGFYGPAQREAHKAGLMSFYPAHISQWMIKKLRHLGAPTVFWGTATPMDKHGNLSLSVGVTYERTALDNADYCVLEINENLPRTFGDSTINIRDIDYVIENTCPLYELKSETPRETDILIGNIIADQIEDESTIQLGIGMIPNAVALSLMHKKDLGVHTEMLTDSMVDLYNAGVITNKKKTLWPNKMIGAFALGSKKLYDFLDDNPRVEFKVGSITNDPSIIAKNYKMVSINTCLQVDLVGQVASETIGPRQYSGTGGQTDTARGAQLSPGGKSIIAMHSTAKKGAISSIVPILDPGTCVSLHRNDVDHVVTEYGVAYLSGRNVRERVKNLIAIAHPQFREELQAKAKELMLW